MLNLKKIISTALALAVTAVASTSVCAADEVKLSDHVPQSVTDSISPRWTNVSWVSATFYIDNNKGVCTGAYQLYSNKKAEITISLMKSTDGNGWSSVESWSKTYNIYNPLSFSKESTNALQHGYYYCTHTQVQVYDSNGKAVETASVFSNYEYY